MLLLGVLEGMAGAALLSIPESTMATKIIGGMLLIQGSDIITTSVMAIYDGERRDSIIHRATKATAMEVGISEQKAELLAKTVNVGIGFVGMRAPLCAKGVGFMKECPKKVITEINNAETKFVPISRWGGELKNGSWVIKGYPTVGNYALSGKNQPTWLIGNNIYTPPNHIKTYLVPKNSLHCPKGREGVKYIFGQRIYKSKK